MLNQPQQQSHTLTQTYIHHISHLHTLTISIFFLFFFPAHSLLFSHLLPFFPYLFLALTLWSSLFLYFSLSLFFTLLSLHSQVVPSCAAGYSIFLSYSLVHFLHSVSFFFVLKRSGIYPTTKTYHHFLHRQTLFGPHVSCMLISTTTMNATSLPSATGCDNFQSS